MSNFETQNTKYESIKDVVDHLYEMNCPDGEGVSVEALTSQLIAGEFPDILKQMDQSNILPNLGTSERAATIYQKNYNNNLKTGYLERLIREVVMQEIYRNEWRNCKVNGGNAPAKVGEIAKRAFGKDYAQLLRIEAANKMETIIDELLENKESLVIAEYGAGNGASIKEVLNKIEDPNQKLSLFLQDVNGGTDSLKQTLEGFDFTEATSLEELSQPGKYFIHEGTFVESLDFLKQSDLKVDASFAVAATHQASDIGLVHDQILGNLVDGGYHVNSEWCHRLFESPLLIYKLLNEILPINEPNNNILQSKLYQARKQLELNLGWENLGFNPNTDQAEEMYQNEYKRLGFTPEDITASNQIIEFWKAHANTVHDENDPDLKQKLSTLFIIIEGHIGKEQMKGVAFRGFQDVEQSLVNDSPLHVVTTGRK